MGLFNSLKYFLRHPLRLPGVLLSRLPAFRFVRETTDYQCPHTFEHWFSQKVLNVGNNKAAYWAVHPTSSVVNPQNIYAGIDTAPGFMRGCYIQGAGGIYVGDYTQIAPNVAIVSSNHDIYDSRKEIKKPVQIGKYCWLAANVSVVPGVTLGDFTIVGAGAVVTKSFPEGYCIIGGVPAQIIKHLDRERCIPFHNKVAYNGYIRSDAFEAFRREHLDIDTFFPHLFHPTLVAE